MYTVQKCLRKHPGFASVCGTPVWSWRVFSGWVVMVVVVGWQWEWVREGGVGRGEVDV